MRFRVYSSMVIAILLAGLFLTTGAGAVELKPKDDPRTAWWQHDRFGMFIHWGIYAVPADSSKGIAEWYMHNHKVPVAEYEKFAAQFNPVKFDADEWVRIAKDAGMKYIIITSKHHDGFCMFDSKLTEYDIIDATPFDRDPLKELSEACKRQGIRLGFYHSVMDWHHPDYTPHRKWEHKARPESEANFDRYIEYMKGQLRELVTNYAPVSVLWFDGAWEGDAKKHHSEEVVALVRSLNPDIIINDRINLPEDHATPEQYIPMDALPEDRLWETCMTMNDTWGYSRNDQNWKSVEDLVRKLVDIAHKGGNFLLNVGPTELGEIPPASVERLRAIGEWMKVNSESIYGTSKSPWRRVPFNGRCTAKGNRLYLHFFDWPSEPVPLSGLKTTIMSASVLGGKGIVRIRTGHDPFTGGTAQTVAVPAERPDPIDSVVVLRFETPPEVDDPGVLVRQSADGTIVLTAEDAEVYGTHARYEGRGPRGHIGFWTDPEDFVEWILLVEDGDRFDVSVLYSCEPDSAGTEYVVLVGNQKLTGLVNSTGSWRSFRRKSVGIVRLRGGRYTLTIRPKTVPHGAVMNLRQIELKPVN